MSGKICVVTDNIHKFEEILEVAKEYGIELEMCKGFKLEFQADGVEDVVLRSAMLAYIFLNKPVLVEDAGLFIEALNGFPGPYSSYTYKTIGIAGILKLLNGVENRKACFKSAVTLVHDKGVFTSTGEVCGVISNVPRGSGGFGFDPIFVPNGETRTFAEMNTREKNLYSHRAMAVRRVFEAFVKDFASTVHL